MVNPGFVRRIPPGEKLSVIPIFCDMIREGAPLGGIVIDDGHWRDLGARLPYLEAHAELALAGQAPWIDPSARVSPTAKIRGATAIGAGRPDRGSRELMRFNRVGRRGNRFRYDAQPLYCHRRSACGRHPLAYRFLNFPTSQSHSAHPVVSHLIDQTVSRFPRFARREIIVHPLEKGGSDRKFYRIAVSDQQSLILAKYGRQREENRHYVAIARFLTTVGVRVPEIYFHDDEEGSDLDGRSRRSRSVELSRMSRGPCAALCTRMPWISF